METHERCIVGWCRDDDGTLHALGAQRMIDEFLYLPAALANQADDDDVFVHPGQVEPNALIIFDNSGSMDEKLCSTFEDESEGYCWSDYDDQWRSDETDDCRRTTTVCEKKVDIAKVKLPESTDEPEQDLEVLPGQPVELSEEDILQLPELELVDRKALFDFNWGTEDK